MGGSLTGSALSGLTVRPSEEVLIGHLLLAHGDLLVFPSFSMFSILDSN